MSYVSLDTTENRSYLKYMEKLTADKYQQTKTTMPIISQETWDNMPEKEKEKIRQDYQNLIDEKCKVSFTNDEISGAKFQMEQLFGKENLQPKPKIRTWEDVQAILPNPFLMSVTNQISDRLFDKMTATYKIAKLIELAYGGMVTEEEWNDDNLEVFCIVPCDTSYGLKIKDCYLKSEKRLIAFHAYKQAEEFMSYPENRALVEQYYMI